MTKIKDQQTITLYCPPLEKFELRQLSDKIKDEYDVRISMSEISRDAIRQFMSSLSNRVNLDSYLRDKGYFKGWE